VLATTPWALPPAKIGLLVDYALLGQQWMSRWNFTVPGTVDRAVSRPDSMKITDLDGNAALLADADPARRPELEQCRARVVRSGTPLGGFRSYPRSDFACYQRPGFSFFVKTISTRTLGAEMGMNGENLKGWHLNSGDTYTLRQGDEYENLAPVWDWSLLPGVTGVAGLDKVERQAFCGAVGDGESGCSAMESQATDGGGVDRLAARKAYFCHGDAVVCLIGGLSAHAGDRPARTALDQRLLRGTVTAGDRTGDAHTLTAGETQLAEVRWIYHDGLVYVPMAPRNLTVRMGPATGTWRAINASGSAATVEKAVFLPFLTHGANLEQGSAGYAIFPCENVAQAADRAKAPGYAVVQNDAACQAVQWSDGMLMAVFYAPGELRGAGRPVLATDMPCLLLSGKGRLFASDPLQHGGPAQISVDGGPAVRVSLPADGTSIEAR
jgi:chondroitin AC lyase